MVVVVPVLSRHEKHEKSTTGQVPRKRAPVTECGSSRIIRRSSSSTMIQLCSIASCLFSPHHHVVEVLVAVVAVVVAVVVVALVVP